MVNRPTIPVLRQLARSGGTIISRCIGCMQGVVLLSEVHPGNLEVTQPVLQARDWFGLVSDADISTWKGTGASIILNLVTLCEERARARGDRLVLRDWTHLDYIGVPYVTPGFGFELGDALADAFDIAEVITVRHPLDQLLSMATLEVLSAGVDTKSYLKGCAAFAERAAEKDFVRYEDFTHEPEAALRRICDLLGIRFDPSWKTRWPSYRMVSGDVNSGSRRSASQEIVPMPRPEAPEVLVSQFRANGDYQRTCSLLGYEP